MTLTEIRDGLALLGAVTLVGGLCFLGGLTVGEDRVQRAMAAADSVVIARAAADAARADTVTRALDSALVGWAKARDRVGTVPRHIRDARPPYTVQRPSDTSTVIIGMGQFDAGHDPATLQSQIDSLRRAGDAVAKACTALAHDCAAVRAERDTLRLALAHTAAALRDAASRVDPRLAGYAAGLYDPRARAAELRTGASLALWGGWHLLAEGDWRIAPSDTARLYVGLMKAWRLW